MKRAIATASLGTLIAGATLASTTAAHAAVPYCHGKRATIVGTPRSEVIHGTPGRDVIAGLAGNDTLDGRGGNDLICGGPGADHLDGGLGNDRLFGGTDALIVTDDETDLIGDSLRGGGGDDYLNGGPATDDPSADEVGPDVYLFDHSPRAVTIDIAKGIARGDGHDHFAGHRIAIVGSRFGDRIDGGPGDDYLNGGPGADVLNGHGGADRLIGDSGRTSANSRDVLRGGTGNDEMSSTTGTDTLFGGRGNDSMDDTGKSADHMDGGPGNDLISDELAATGDGAALNGGSGVDHLTIFTSHLHPLASPATAGWNMQTGAITSTFTGAVHAAATGFENADLMSWGAAWTVYGTAGPNILIAGGSAGTTFYGLRGDDTFMGSAYSDVFDGGPGNDRSLGMGADTNDNCISVESFDYPDCDHISRT